MLDLQSWSLGLSGLLLQWKQGRYTHTHTHAHTHARTHAGAQLFADLFFLDIGAEA